MPGSLQAFLTIFLLGSILRAFGLLHQQHAERLAAIVFTVSLPATILISFDGLVLTPSVWKLPVAAWLVTATVLVLSWRVARALDLPRPTQGGFLLGTGCINSVYFAYPVAMATLGSAGLAHAILFDLGQTPLTLTALYALAVWHGEGGRTAWTIVRRLLTSPPLWALTVSLLLKVFGLGLPPWLVEGLRPLHATTTPWASLVLGLSISLPAIRQTLPLAVLGVVLRMGGGVMVGLLVAAVLDLSGVARAVVVLIAGMPSAVTAVLFAAETRLDEGLVAAIVALSLLVGVALLPWVPIFARALTMP